MGFRFRRSIKIIPGVRVNIGKKGVSSVSLGGRGARTTISKKGVRNTVGLTGTGLSYSSYQAFNNTSTSSQNSSPMVNSQYNMHNTQSDKMIQKYCVHCRRNTYQKKSFGAISYLFGGFFTGGLWWILGLIYHFGFQTPICTVCGNYSENKKIGMKKYWFITLFAIILFLSFLKEKPGLAITITAIILGAFGLSEYKKKKDLKLQAQLAEEKAFSIEQSKNEIRPYINKFINSFTSDWTIWPQNTFPTQEQIIALIFLINRDRNIPVDENLIKNMVSELLEQRSYLIFKNSFMKEFSAIYTELTASDAANVYQILFSKNMSNLRLLNALLQENAIYIDSSDLCSLIIQKYEAYKLNRQANELEYAMSNQLAINTPISIQDTDELDGVEFENILSILFAKMGYMVQTTPRSGDQGADLLLEKNGYKTVVQAKRYTKKLDNTSVQEVVAAKYHYQYDDAMVVTNNYFTTGAKELAATNQVKLIDRDVLQQLLIDYPINK